MVVSMVIIASLAITVEILVSERTPTPNEIGLPSSLNTGYEIDDMSGEKIQTFVSWNIVKGDLFHIHVEESPELTPQKMADINAVLYSNSTVTVNGDTYYKGWDNALKSIQTKEEYVIPTNFHTVVVPNDVGNIIIHLTDAENGDGYSGYTKSIVDAPNHQILKSDITIYEIDKLTDDEFRAILRHELGHAFGLKHSDNPDDLMHAIVNMENPYISQCDIIVIEGLYNGQQHSMVGCT